MTRLRACCWTTLPASAATSSSAPTAIKSCDTRCALYCPSTALDAMVGSRTGAPELVVAAAVVATAAVSAPPFIVSSSSKATELVISEVSPATSEEISEDGPPLVTSSTSITAAPFFWADKNRSSEESTSGALVLVPRELPSPPSLPMGGSLSKTALEKNGLPVMAAQQKAKQVKIKIV